MNDGVDVRPQGGEEDVEGEGGGDEAMVEVLVTVRRSW